MYGQYPPDWTALLTLKVSVCVSNGKIAWATGTASQRKAAGVTGGPWPQMPATLEKTTTTRKIGLAATYLLDVQRAEPSVWITFTVNSGFAAVTVGDEMFH